MSNKKIQKEIDTGWYAKEQPDPPIAKGGDCGPCCLSNLVDMPIKDIYSDLFDFDKPQGVSWNKMRTAINKARHRGLLSASITDIPIWPQKPHSAVWGFDSAHQSGSWGRYIKMAMRAKYVGIAFVDMEQEGGPRANHWVLITGWRLIKIIFEDEENGNCSATYSAEILTSCPQNGKEWVKIKDFLKNWGGYNTILVKP